MTYVPCTVVLKIQETDVTADKHAGIYPRLRDRKCFHSSSSSCIMESLVFASSSSNIIGVFEFSADDFTAKPMRVHFLVLLFYIEFGLNIVEINLSNVIFFFNCLLCYHYLIFILFSILSTRKENGSIPSQMSEKNVPYNAKERLSPMYSVFNIRRTFRTEAEIGSIDKSGRVGSGITRRQRQHVGQGANARGHRIPGADRRSSQRRHRGVVAVQR